MILQIGWCDFSRVLPIFPERSFLYDYALNELSRDVSCEISNLYLLLVTEVYIYPWEGSRALSLTHISATSSNYPLSLSLSLSLAVSICLSICIILLLSETCFHWLGKLKHRLSLLYYVVDFCTFFIWMRFTLRGR